MNIDASGPPLYGGWEDVGRGALPPRQEPAREVIIRGPDTTIHLVLTVLTCGLWLPIWIIAAITGKRRITLR